MKNIIVKGKSEKAGFSMTIPQEELIAFLQMVIEKSAEEFDSELATSPGGLPTALFTCICPGKAREDVGWKMEDGCFKTHRLNFHHPASNFQTNYDIKKV